MKTTKKGIGGALLIISVIQILLMINTSVANSYLINEENVKIESNIEGGNNFISDLVDTSLALITGFFSLKQIGTVSAVTDIRCCQEMKDGSICQDIAYPEESSLCDGSAIPTECANVPECKQGCCIDTERGICSPNSPQSACSGEWKEGAGCEVQECKQGCCAIGDDYSFKTEAECNYTSSQRGIQEAWSEISEPQCLALSSGDSEGACTFSNRTCQITTGEECSREGGNFAEGILCSHPQLNATCQGGEPVQKQAYVGCDLVGEKDGIYWFDSCGNIENIYDSNKIRSWNNGEMLSPQQSCGAGSGNINSATCGNCNRDFSSICAVATGNNKIIDGDYVCEDLSCHFEDEFGNQVTKENHESWCSYEGRVGDGKDTVGSEHWKYYCDEGKVFSERKGNYRNYICVETTIGTGNNAFSVAELVPNQASLCRTYEFYGEEGITSSELKTKAQEQDLSAQTIDKIILGNGEVKYSFEGIKSCLENNQCMVKNIEFGGWGKNSPEYKSITRYMFSTCVGKYPEGSSLNDDGADDGLCNIKLPECTVIYEKKNRLDDWQCKGSYDIDGKKIVANCECEDSVFAEKMNDLCISLGDCGSYVNYIGEGTDNIDVDGGRPPSSLTGFIHSIFSGEKQCQTLNVCGYQCSMQNICTGLGQRPPCHQQWVCSGDLPVGYENQTEFHTYPRNSGMINVNGIYVGDYLKTSKDSCMTKGICTAGEFEIKDSLSVNWQDYQNYATAKEGEYAEPPNLNQSLELLFGEDFSGVIGSAEYENSIIKLVAWAGGIPGATGSLLWVGSKIGLWSLSHWVDTIPATSAGAPFELVATTLGTIAVAAGGFVVGAAIGAWGADKLGLTGIQATAFVLSMGVLGSIAALAVIGVNIWNPAGWIALGVVIFTAILGGVEYKQYAVSFQCLPWEAPDGGSDCEVCNNNPLKPCTEYRCQSLGKACVYLNGQEDTQENGECKSIPRETNPPIITPIRVEQGYRMRNITQGTSQGVEIRESGGGCIPTFTPVSVTFKTDEFAQCKWASEIVFPNYNNLDNNYPVERSAYTLNHTFVFDMPSISALESEDVWGDLRAWYGNLNREIVCRDYWGNFNHPAFRANFCVEKEDKLPVEYDRIKTTPINGAKLPLGTTNLSVKMLINKPAECKYDTRPYSSNANPTQVWSLMPNNLTCQTGLTAWEIGPDGAKGWPCLTRLTNLTEGVNRIYVRCKAQPYFNTVEYNNATGDIIGINYSRDGERAINGQDFVYTLTVTREELKIDSVKFKHEGETTQIVSSGGTIKVGVSPIAVSMEVKTSGGVDEGLAFCKWGVEETGGRSGFWNTGGTTHTQTLSPRFENTHTNYIVCEDSAGNIAKLTTNFTIDVDTVPPRVINVTNTTVSGEVNVKLITDEDAQCYYNVDQCSTDLENQTSITLGIDTEHDIYGISPRLNYYVTCEDGFGHKNPDCAIVINASERDDEKAPELVRVFYDSEYTGELKLFTDEEAQCYYTADSCDFAFDEAIPMTREEYSKEHFAEWNPKMKYHVKCTDSWENPNNGCLVVVEAFEIFQSNL